MIFKEVFMLLKSLFFSFVAVSCATSAPKATVQVIERSDSYESKPSWASIDNPTKTENGKKTFTSSVTVEGEDVSKSALLNMSDEKAFSEPMRSLVDQFLDQNQVGEDIRSSSSVGTRIISAARGYRPPMPSLEIINRYYETAIITLPNGSYRYETRAYSRVSVDIGDFEKAKRIYFNRLNGTSEVQDILKEVGSQQREAIQESNKQK